MMSIGETTEITKLAWMIDSTYMILSAHCLQQSHVQTPLNP